MRRTRILGTILCSGFLLLACEDGPSLDGPAQVLNNKPTDRSDRTNGLALPDPWAIDDNRDFEVEASGDAAGRARFCDDSEAETQVQDMISAAIMPDQGLGKIPLWGAGFKPLLADDLLGKPANGKYCDPSGTYSNAFTFGPLAEIVIIFDEQTRLVESMYAQKGYLGAMEGTVQDAAGKDQKVWIRPGDPVRVGNAELKDDNPESLGHWLHPQNINLMYRMMRQSYFPAAPPPEASFDCLSSRICRILEIGSYRALRVEDSGVVLIFPPTSGAVNTILLEPVRVAPFEASASLTTGTAPLAVPDPKAPAGPIEDVALPLAPAFQSGIFDSCSLTLDGSVTWRRFRDNCTRSEDTLSRASYSVAYARDTVSVDFNGVFLTFMRKLGAAPLKDGERPGDEDVLSAIAFTDNLNGPLMQWVPKLLGAHFQQRLEARVRNALYISDGEHPLTNFSLGQLPDLGDGPTQLSPVRTSGGEDLVQTYVAQAQAAYAALSPAQKAVVNPALADETYLIGSFVEAAMAVLTGGATDEPKAVVRTIPSDDALRVTGRANFMQNGQAYRIVTSYNLVFGGMVYIVIQRGFSAVDEPINLANTLARNTQPYYEHYLSLAELGLAEVNPFSLGAASIEVMGQDRLLGMLSVKISMQGEGAEPRIFNLEVPGEHITEGAGFMRQVKGETKEFVRAHSADFYGQESVIRVNIDENGVVRRVVQGTFKGPAYLCGAGRAPVIRYGDDVRAAVEAFSKQSPAAFHACGIVYNYSPNKNVLDSVVSVINKVGITLSGGRAVSVDAWQ